MFIESYMVMHVPIKQIINRQCDNRVLFILALAVMTLFVSCVKFTLGFRIVKSKCVWSTHSNNMKQMPVAIYYLYNSHRFTYFYMFLLFSAMVKYRASNSQTMKMEGRQWSRLWISSPHQRHILQR